MFKKIRSDRDPRDTLYSEIRREFGTYFTSLGGWLKRGIERNPRLTFYGMIGLMAGSITISILFFRYKPSPKKGVPNMTASPVQDGFDQILNASAKIRKTLELKRLVDSLTSKKVLTARDSIALDSALSSLQSIRKTIK